MSTRDRGQTGWLVAGLALTTVTVIAGALTVGLWLARQTETQHHTYQHPGSRIDLDLPDLDVHLTPGATGELAVERHLTWSYRKPTIGESWNGQTLRATADCPLNVIGPGCHVDYAVRVPPGTTVHIDTGAGDITIGEVDGELTLSTVSGDVRGTGLRCGQATVESRSGDVDLRFDQPPQRIQVTTGSGDISVRLPPGTDPSGIVQARTTTGNIRLR
jgi:hypothetical protein